MTRHLRSHRVGARARSRASVMLEFALVFPIALAIMLFAVDMGRLVLISTGLHDSVAVAARAGARQGYAGTNSSGPARDAFDEATTEVPGLDGNIEGFSIDNPTTTFTGTQPGRWCTTSDEYVRVTGTANVQFITPGLGTLLTVTGGGRSSQPRSVDISATGVARCEVTR